MFKFTLDNDTQFIGNFKEFKKFLNEFYFQGVINIMSLSNEDLENDYNIDIEQLEGSELLIKSFEIVYLNDILEKHIDSWRVEKIENSNFQINSIIELLDFLERLYPSKKGGIFVNNNIILFYNSIQGIERITFEDFTKEYNNENELKIQINI